MPPIRPAPPARMRDGLSAGDARDRFPARSRCDRASPARAHGGVLSRLAGQSARRGRRSRAICAAVGLARALRLPGVLRRVLFRNLHADPARRHAGGARTPDFANVVVFQSLSKRSNLPGLRVGFGAGDRHFLPHFLELRNVARRRCRCPPRKWRRPPTATKRM